MATAAQLPGQEPAEERNGAASNDSMRDVALEAALVQTAPVFGESAVPGGNPLIALLPVEVDVAVPIRGFRVRNLLSLDEGEVVASQWLQGDDLPLSARGAQLAWAEFEVIDTKLAVRIARLA